MTLDLDGMIEVLQALKAPLMIPMHYFSTYTLHRFLDRAREQKWDGRDGRGALDRDLEDDAADDAEGAGAAGALSRGSSTHDARKNVTTLDERA